MLQASMTSATQARVQRTFGPDFFGEPRDDRPAPYLVSIDTLPRPGAHRWEMPMVQARCVVDDFGDLMAVEVFE